MAAHVSVWHASRASPEVAAYPFTTLMPNLGVMPAGMQGSDADSQWASRSGPVLADLPGLIDGAHKVCMICAKLAASATH